MTANANVMDNLRGIGRNAMLGVPLLLLALLMMLVVPLPPLMLDLFFTFNIALSLVVVLACVYSRRPLAFATFRRCCWWPRCCVWRSISPPPASCCSRAMPAPMRRAR